MALGLLAPELTVFGLALLVLGLDLVLPDHRRPLLGYLVAAGLLGAIVLTAGLAGQRAVILFETLVVDDLAIFFKLLFLIAALLLSLTAVDYLRERALPPGEYFALLLGATAGFLLLASAREFVSLYVALELSALCLYLLAGFERRTPQSPEAGLKYVLMGAAGSAALLYGIALLFALTGTMDLARLGQVLAAPTPLTLLAAVLLVAGLGVKVAAVPFHMWVPDVYQGAPTPVTAFLAVASKAAGFVVLLRVCETALGALADLWPLLFGGLAALTMTVGNLLALPQTDLKRLLGYSSVAQAGYALMGLAVASPALAASLVFFLLTYLWTTLATFLVVVFFSARLGSDEIAAYQGLGREAPRLLTVSLTVGLLSLIGLPPMAGFIGKVYLFATALGQGLLWLVVLALFNTALSAAYYLRVLRALFLQESPEPPPALKVPRTLQAALAVALLGLFGVGLYPGPFLSAAARAVQVLFP